MNTRTYIFPFLSDHVFSMTIDIYFILYVNKVMGLTGGIGIEKEGKRKINYVPSCHKQNV